MKKQILFGLITLILGFVVGLVVSSFRAGAPPSSAGAEDRSNTEGQVAFYTCSMHPNVKLAAPGKCPRCAMDLIPVSVGEDESLGPRELQLSPRAMKLSEVESVPVERKFVSANVRMVGKVEYDETRLAYITSWIPGRLDRLFVDYTGVRVKEGDHLVKLYSPELLQAQEELLSAINRAADLSQSRSEFLKGRREGLVGSAREKLRLWGLSEEQIQTIESRGKATDHMTINSPISGVVVHKNAVEGMYVQTGSRVYTIADLSEVWVKLDAYESDLPWIHYGQEVEFRTDAFPGEVFRGQIAFIDPILNPKTRTVKIRVNLPNPEGKLKPDMFVRAIVKSRVAEGGRVMDAGMAGKWISPMHPEIVKDNPGECDICGMDLVSAESLGYVPAETDRAPLVIPASAPLITGRRAVVYVDHGNGRYEGREIVLGARAGNYYLVESGLTEGERVVRKGNFKIDSAIQILAKPSMMNPESRGEGSTQTERGDEQHRSGEMPSFDVPDAFREQLGEWVGAYVTLMSELSLDRGDGAAQQVSIMVDLLESIDGSLLERDIAAHWRGHQEVLAKHLSSMKEAADIVGLRLNFEKLSDSLVSVLREFGVQSARSVFLYHCPMAFKGRGANWLQSSQGTTNPYYGSEMFGCGSLKEVLSEASSLTPQAGHEGHDHE